jgi:mono/diheme cytochrome c family protein
MTDFVLGASGPMFAANFRAIGLSISILTMLAFVGLFFRNVYLAKDELGSEIELAANRKPYLSDEELEGTKLDRSLTFALIVLGITSLIIPFYWLAEPGRQDGSLELKNETFAIRGERLYTGGAQCVNCHAAGGAGGPAPYVFQDADGQFLGNATWNAPALNNVLLRYSEEEVTYILNYGRPGSPMAAWGTPGGGPLTSQQVEYLVAYLQTLQEQSVELIELSLSEDPAEQVAADKLNDAAREEVARSLDAGEFDSAGEAVFNMGLFSGFKSGSLSCGRCHTAGWSLGTDSVPDALDEANAACGGGDPSGIGYSLCGGITERFPHDTWLKPDGGWLEVGESPIAEDGTVIELDDKGKPLTGASVDFEPVLYEVLDGGDLADCSFKSNLWEPDGVASDAYPYDGSDFAYVADESEDGFVDPPELSASDLSGETVVLSGGRLGGDCTVVAMPPRTSQANFDFIYNGAEAGKGYGRGGQSHRGMMPAFGAILPSDLIQEVVNYIRGLE